MICERPFLNSGLTVFEAMQQPGKMFLVNPCKGCEKCIPTKELYADVIV